MTTFTVTSGCGFPYTSSSAGLANDGSIDNDNCFTSSTLNNNATDPWWAVDLGQSTNVSCVTVVLRAVSATVVPQTCECASVIYLAINL